MTRSAALAVVQGFWIACLAALEPATAQAQADTTVWTASIGVNAVGGLDSDEPDASGTDALGAVVALNVTTSPWVVGLGIAASDRDLVLSEAVTVTDEHSFSVSGWLVRSFGATSVSLAVDYGEDGYEGEVSGTPFAQAPKVDSDTQFISVGTSVSHVFGTGTRIVPSLGVAWTQSETQTRLISEGLTDLDLGESRTDDGLSGTLGLDIGHDVTPWFILTGRVAGTIAENEAATSRSGLTFGRGLTGPTSSASEESVAWADVAVGAVFVFGANTVSIDALATAGQEADFVTAGLTLSRSF
ncbi:MAG: hypothetical protein ACFB6R_11810 [Alphaproteobacteria bacterium]